MLASFVKTIRRYGEVVGWLLRDLFSAFGKAIGAILLIRILGLGFLIGTLAVISGYARILERGEQVEVGGRAIEPQGSMTLLLMVGGASLVLMICGSVLTYLSNRKAAQLRSDYTAYCAQRIISCVHEAVEVELDGQEAGVTVRALQRLARRSSILCGRVASQLISSVFLPAIVTVIAVPVLLHINPMLTLLMGVLLGITLLVHFKLNVRAARQMIEREKYSSAAGREYKEMLEQGAHQIRAQRNDAVAARFGSDPIRASIEAETRYRVVPYDSTFLSDLFLAVGIMAVLVVLGGRILREGQGWDELLVFLVASRYTLGQIRNLLSGIANSNRFYHQIREYFQFVHRARGAGPNAAGAPPEQLMLEMGRADAIEGVDGAVADEAERQLAFWPMSEGETFERVTVYPGQRIGVLTDIPLNRLTVPQLLGGLLGRAGRPERVEEMLGHTVAVTRRGRFLPGNKLSEALGLDGGDGLRAIQPILAACGLWQRVEPLFERRAEAACEMDAPVPREMDDELRIGLLIASVIAAGKRIVMLERGALRRLSYECRDAMLEQLGGAIVFVVGDDPDGFGRFGESLIAVVAGEELVGLGDVRWMKAHADEIRAALGASAGLGAGGAGSAGQDEVMGDGDDLDVEM